LFQTEWSQHVSSKTPNLLTWSSIQRERLEKLLSWQKQMINDAPTSPWTYLKLQKPDPELFI
jgi:hypothetical protein